MLTGELWLVAGEDTGEDSLLMEEAAGEGEKKDVTVKMFILGSAPLMPGNVREECLMTLGNTLLHFR